SQQLGPRNVDAHGLGRDLVLPDGKSRASRARSNEVPYDDDNEHEEEERPYPGGELWYAEHSASPLHLGEGQERVRVVQQGLHHNGEAESGDAEIVAPQSQHGEPEQEAHLGGKASGNDDRKAEDNLLHRGGG